MKSNYQLALAALGGVALGAAAIQGLHAQARPPAYAITEVEIINQDAFKEFGPKAEQSMKATGGKYLARGGQVVAVDGQAPKRVIVTVYDSMAKAQERYNSAAWKELTPLREKAVKGRTYIVDGLAN